MQLSGQGFHPGLDVGAPRESFQQANRRAHKIVQQLPANADACKSCLHHTAAGVSRACWRLLQGRLPADMQALLLQPSLYCTVLAL